MKVVMLPEARAYLKGLAQVLYEKEYFGLEEAAHRYADELFAEIKAKLPSRLHKPAPKHFARYGRGLYYAVFKKNRHTQYYAFFSKYNDGGETVYQVRHIANNHTAAHYL